METTILELHNNEWLSDALRRGGYGEYIPTNVILDKTLTGVGATYCEIQPGHTGGNILIENIHKSKKDVVGLFQIGELSE